MGPATDTSIAWGGAVSALTAGRAPRGAALETAEPLRLTAVARGGAQRPRERHATRAACGRPDMQRSRPRGPELGAGGPLRRARPRAQLAALITLLPFTICIARRPPRQSAPRRGVLTARSSFRPWPWPPRCRQWPWRSTPAGLGGMRPPVNATAALASGCPGRPKLAAVAAVAGGGPLAGACPQLLHAPAAGA